MRLRKKQPEATVEEIERALSVLANAAVEGYFREGSELVELKAHNLVQLLHGDTDLALSILRTLTPVGFLE